MNKSNRTGMTLVEIMVSILLAGIAFASVAAALSMGLSSIRVMREMTCALQSAQTLIEETRGKSFSKITPLVSTPVTLYDVSGSISMAVQDEGTINRNKVSVNVSWTSGGRSHNVTLVTYMTKGGINPK